MDDIFANLRYLIIEDFEQMRVSFKGMLSAFGAEDIHSCAHGEEAVKLLAREGFDVVICDYNLGEGKDGQQVLEEARHTGCLGHASTFVMITAESNMPMVLGVLEQQPDEYMIKPINREVFFHRLKGAVIRKRKLEGIDEALAMGDTAGAIDRCIEQRRDGDLTQNLYLAKLQAELCLDLKRYDDAEDIYRELLKIRDFPWAVFGLGKIDYHRGDLQSAETRFRELIDQNRFYVQAYDWLVVVLEAKGDSEQALALLKEAVKLSPKLVDRQRKLGQLASRNNDLETAERAFQSSIRWGRHSCFASAEEYRHLADIYQQSGQTTKMLRALAEGCDRFSHQPTNKVSVLCGLAHAKQRLGREDEVDNCLREVTRLVGRNKYEISGKDLLQAADDLFQLSRSDAAQEMLKLVLCNHHDEDHWLNKVRGLMQTHDQGEAAETLIKNSRKELMEIHGKCVELLHGGGVEQAIRLLNDTVDQYPDNRTIVLMAVSAMIDYMRESGLDQRYHFRCRFSLNQLLLRDSEDMAAERYLAILRRQFMTLAPLEREHA